MNALSVPDVLAIWERGLDASPSRRALEMLCYACPDTEPGQLAALSIGQRDRLLLSLRELSFGSLLTGLVDCLNCGERIETAFRATDLPAAAPVVESELSVGRYQLRIRPPNTNDLAFASDPDLMRARVQLLLRCVVLARADGVEIESRELPGNVLDAAEGRLSELDPLSDIQFAIDCPGCHTRRTVAFDIVSFLWREIEAMAHRLLREVHTLAAAYGWTEPEVLALSPVRRQCYLELAGG